MALLDQIDLENFGCFSRLSLTLSPFSVFVGPNDSGKTTLLNAVRAIRCLAIEDPADRERPVSIQTELQMPALRWSAAPADALVRLGIRGSPDTVGPFELSATLVPQPSREMLKDVSLETPAGATRIESSRGAPGALFKLGRPLHERSGVVEQLRQAITRIEYVRLDPAALKAPSLAPTSEEVPRLESNGAGLPTLLSVMSGLSRSLVDRIEKQFTSAVPTLQGFHIKPASIHIKRESLGVLGITQAGHRLVFQPRYSAVTLEASQVSDGALLFLGFLTLLHHPQPPTVLLIEEPENGVHPSRLRDIARLLRKLTVAADGRPAVQILMTTHSPYLLDEFAPEEAYFCTRTGEGDAQVRRFCDIPDIAERLADYRLGELWTAYGEPKLAELAAKG